MNNARFIRPKFFTGIFLPDWLLEMDLSHGAMILYGKLARLALKRGYAFAGYELFSQLLGVSLSQVSSYMGELKDKNLIEVKRTGRANHIYLLAHDAMTISNEEMAAAEERYGNDEPDEIRLHNSENRFQYTENRFQKIRGLYNERENLKREGKQNKNGAIAPEVIPPGVSVEVWQEYRALRKRKRAPITEFVFKHLCKTLAELQSLGYSPDEALTKAINRNWQGLEVEWFQKDNFRQQKEGDLSERTKRILRRGMQ